MVVDESTFKCARVGISTRVTKNKFVSSYRVKRTILIDIRDKILHIIYAYWEQNARYRFARK
ncbi:hypothetical protein HanRHA438_Chr02g0086801 [Helianthus annuus]|nr:hypothetical protein HanRHA438_Chr02g0086801 [Helianthus annuus]